jgi:hypothetical protein
MSDYDLKTHILIINYSRNFYYIKLAVNFFLLKRMLNAPFFLNFEFIN